MGRAWGSIGTDKWITFDEVLGAVRERDGEETLGAKRL
jgi:hypothetical protein